MRLIGLYDPESRRVHVVSLTDKMEFIPTLGMINTSRFKNLSYGDTVEIFGLKFYIVKPSLYDIINMVQKRTQTVNFKDIGKIISLLGLKHDSDVVEIGVGSGHMTLSILYYLNDGKLTSYDISENSIKYVEEIVNMLGLNKNWIPKVNDIRNGIDERDIDSIFIDIPEPWTSIKNIYDSLKAGGILVAYIPNLTQVKEMKLNMEKAGFVDIQITETIERKWFIGDVEMRPEFTGLLHTSFIVHGRRLHK
ncbi:MAG: tRNA (adenine-N1)-methyltransferase [Thermoplasmata archaeon]